MKKHLEVLMKKHREVLLYLFFGVLTTFIDALVYRAVSQRLGGPLKTAAATAVAWLASVSFAYLANRTWVFGAHAAAGGGIAREAGSFFGSRLFSGLVDIALMVTLVDFLGFSEYITKLGVIGLVVVLNYILSKFVIFRKK